MVAVFVRDQDQVRFREFRRIVRTGTMDVRRQLARPAREVAIAIWITSIDSMSERAGKGTST